MRGEFVGIWLETYREIWDEMAAHELSPTDLYCELYRELATALRQPLSVEALAGIIDSPDQSKAAFENISSEEFLGERALVAFLESAHSIFEDLGGDTLSNYYFNLLTTFAEKFSLRYDLRRPCTLCPTLPGVFASLIRDLRSATSKDAHLDTLMKEFENSIRDLRTDFRTVVSRPAFRRKLIS